MDRFEALEIRGLAHTIVNPVSHDDAERTLRTYVIRRSWDALDALKGMLVKAYERRTGVTEAELNEMFDNETWLTAEEAVSKGFADEVVETGKRAAVAMAMAGGEAKVVYDAMNAALEAEVEEVAEVVAETEAAVESAQEAPEATEEVVAEVAAEEAPETAEDAETPKAGITINIMDSDVFKAKVEEYNAAFKVLEEKLATANAKLEEKTAEANALGEKAAELNAKVREFEAEKAQAKIDSEKAAVERVLDAAVLEGKIKSDGKDTWRSLADGGVAKLMSALETLPSNKKAVVLFDRKTAAGSVTAESYSELSKNDPARLKYLRDNEPDVFAALFKAEFGTLPK